MALTLKVILFAPVPWPMHALMLDRHVCLEFRDLDLSYAGIEHGLLRDQGLTLFFGERAKSHREWKRQDTRRGGREDTGRGGRYMPSPPSYEPRKLTEELSSVVLGLLTYGAEDTLAERLRRRPAKLMGPPRVGSNPTGVVSCPACACYASLILTETNQSRCSVLPQKKMSTPAAHTPPEGSVAGPQTAPPWAHVHQAFLACS